MKLIVDANVLISELLRRRGRELMRNSRLELYLAQQVRDETEYELRQRITYIVNQGRISENAGEMQLDAALSIINTQMITVALSDYAYLETEARKRIPRDPNDWQVVALALVLPAAIWTEDRDFFGCGCPIWTTETLLLQLS